MPRYNAPFEIHVHGDVPLRADVTFDQIQEALRGQEMARGFGKTLRELLAGGQTPPLHHPHR